MALHHMASTIKLSLLTLALLPEPSHVCSQSVQPRVTKEELTIQLHVGTLQTLEVPHTAKVDAPKASTITLSLLVFALLPKPSHA